MTWTTWTRHGLCSAILCPKGSGKLHQMTRRLIFRDMLRGAVVHVATAMKLTSFDDSARGESFDLYSVKH